MNIRLFPRPDEPIGYYRDGRPIYPQAGGAADTGIAVEPDGDGAGDDDSDTDDSGSSSAKYTPPDRAEWLRTQNALSKANASAKTRREALAEANKRIAELEAERARREAEDERRALTAQTQPTSAVEPAGKGKKGRGGVAPAPAPQPLPDSVLTKAQVKQMMAEAAREAKAAAAAEMTEKLAIRAAREALVGEGVSKVGVARLVKLVELSDIEFDDDGEVVGGLDEQVEQLKLEFPQLFKASEPEKPKQKRAPVTRATAAGRQDAAPEYKSSAERMAAQIMGAR